MRTTIVLLLFSMGLTAMYGQIPNINMGHLNTKLNVAMEGYDPVSYFTNGQAVKGNKNFAVKSNGIVYICSSRENLELFKQSPEKYKPQYGGWCAYAMGAKGTKVEVDPETFKIIQGKLFLFYNKGFTNTRSLWNKDEPALKTKADLNWKTIISK
jgi:YHS domain-containing protein